MGNGDISAINLPDVSMDRMEFEQFQLIENGSSKSKAVLLSNIGFKYTLSRKIKTTSYWRCYKQANVAVYRNPFDQLARQCISRHLKSSALLKKKNHRNCPTTFLASKEKSNVKSHPRYETFEFR